MLVKKETMNREDWKCMVLVTIYAIGTEERIMQDLDSEDLSCEEKQMLATEHNFGIGFRLLYTCRRGSSILPFRAVRAWNAELTR